MAERLNLRNVVRGEHGEVLAQRRKMLDDLDLAVLREERRAQAGDLIEQLRRLVDDARADVQRVAQRIKNGIIDAQQNRVGDEHRQAPAGHAHAFLLVKLLHFLVELHLVVGVDLLKLLDLFLHLRLRSHGLLLLHGEGEHQHLHNQGEQNNGHAVIPDDPVKEPQQVPQQAAEPVKNIHHRRKTPLSW